MTKIKPDSKVQDQETQAMMYEGASLSQLAQLFDLDVRVVKAKLHGLSPTNKRAGHPIYRIKDAAAYLVHPHYTLDEFVQKMTRHDLPPSLQKEFWAGMRSRQLYEQAAGELWPTEKVVEHITEILKVIALSIKVSADKVERSTGLTAPQRQEVTRLMDDALRNAHSELERMINSRTDIDGRSIPDIVVDDEADL